jgi:hypothetical protein
VLAAIDYASLRAVFRIRSAHITEAQWSHYSETFARLGAVGHAGGAVPCLVCVSEPGSDMPPAKVRQRFAEIGSSMRPDSIFVLVTASAAARGIVTAVNWVRPFPFRYAVAATWADGVDAACQLDPSPTLRGDLERLFKEGRLLPP